MRTSTRRRASPTAHPARAVQPRFVAPFVRTTSLALAVVPSNRKRLAGGRVWPVYSTNVARPSLSVLLHSHPPATFASPARRHFNTTASGLAARACWAWPLACLLAAGSWKLDAACRTASHHPHKAAALPNDDPPNTDQVLIGAGCSESGSAKGGNFAYSNTSVLACQWSPRVCFRGWGDDSCHHSLTIGEARAHPMRAWLRTR